MKYLFFLLVVISISKNAYGQDTKGNHALQPSSHSYICDRLENGIPVQKDRIYYSEIDTVQAAKDTLYIRSKSFLSSIFPNFNNVVKLDDKELGKVVVRGIFKTPSIEKGIFIRNYSFYGTITIEVKDNRYRYEISDLVRTDANYGLEVFMMTKKGSQKLAELLVPYMDGIVSSIKKNMRENGAAW